ncbi:MAG: ATP-binding cassette domain-containing protein [Pseudorhodobacter sp.]
MLNLDGLDIRQGGFRLTASWSIPPGARIAIIGPSGAGKSTLLSVIGGFFAPFAGRTLWAGQDITRKAPGKRPITTLFQDQNLFPHLTLAQNVGLGIDPSLRLTASDHARVEGALVRVGLAGMATRRPSELSGGQQSRAALARTLLRDRPVLLLDEPFAALGPALKAEMLALVGEIAIQAGTTVLMVTHDPADARRFAPQTCLVADGTAATPVATGSLLDDPPPALEAYLGTPGGRPPGSTP